MSPVNIASEQQLVEQISKGVKGVSNGSEDRSPKLKNGTHPRQV